MGWFSRYIHWLKSEAEGLASSSDYNEQFQFVDKTLVSSGSIVVHKEDTRYHPVLIVYPDATPYVAPIIYTLKTNLDEKAVRDLSSCPFDEIGRRIQDKIEFYERRHQNQDGSICFLEAGDLHSESAEAYPIKDILRRVRIWLAGRIPNDSPEVELFSHFRQRNLEIQYLLPDVFFDTNIVRGQYYAALSSVIPSLPPKTFIGTLIMGENASGVTIPPKVYNNEGLVLFAPMPDLRKIIFDREAEAIERQKEEGNLIIGAWWDINQEPEPFSAISPLADYIGNGDENKGIKTLVGALEVQLNKLEDLIHIGLRFPGRHREKDWQMFVLRRKGRPAIVGGGFQELQQRILDYDVEAVNQEYLTEEYFHMRNAGRAERSILRQNSLSIIGAGALGSETADALAKAGIGRLKIVDKELLKAHNAVRHCLGINRVGFPKSLGMQELVYFHNPFVEIENDLADILRTPLYLYLPQEFIGISTIADDNIEAYLNQEAVINGRTMFYCRGLRGGKSARIFRVIPHRDACKTCLSLYRQSADPVFKDIPEDEKLPVITNECNNPVRPASAADVKTIAGIFSRIVIDYLQDKNREMNHWIWSSESLEPVAIETPVYGSLSAWNIPPHPKCAICLKLEETAVRIDQATYDFIKRESAASADVETGGVLIGSRTKEGQYSIVRATGPGPKAVRSATRFEKDVEYCQSEIKRAFYELGDKGLYLGEWHYHAMGGTSPSGIDIKSLTEIAAQDNYKIDRPVMIILSTALEYAITIHDETGRCVSLPLQIASE